MVVLELNRLGEDPVVEVRLSKNVQSLALTRHKTVT